MFKVLLLYLLGIGFISSCNSSSPIEGNVQRLPIVDGQDKTKNNDNRPSEENPGIPGYIIKCKESSINKQRSNFSCGIANENRVLINVSSEIVDFEYSIRSAFPLAFNKLVSDDPYYPINFDVNIEPYGDISLSEIYRETLLSADGVFKNSGKQLDITTRIAQALIKSESVTFNYLRFKIESIGRLPITGPNVCISSIIFYDNGIAFANNYDFETGQESIGGAPVLTSASTSLAPTSHGLVNDTIYWESETEVFSSNPPFDAVENTWFQVEFQTIPMVVDAVKINSHTENSLGECVPDSISILGSQDELNWVVLARREILNPDLTRSIYIEWK